MSPRSVMSTLQRLQPREIPGYELIRVLGRGGMGEVFLARQQGLDRSVALKLLRADHCDERARVRFQREATIMHRVRHPNLIRLYDFGQAGEHLWMALELVKGRSLDQVLHDEGAQPQARAFEIMMRVAEALGALHAEGALHRDVKPANIMLEEGGRPVLMDLGLVQSTDMTALTSTGSVVGTPVYMAPEAIAGAGWEPDVDWFSWGMTFWELLAGGRPYEMKDLLAALQRREAPFIPPARSPHGPVDPTYAAMIRRCLMARGKRPSSLDEVRAMLEVEPAEADPEEAPTQELARVRSASLSMGLSGSEVEGPRLLPAWLRSTLVGVALLLLLLGVRKAWRASVGDAGATVPEVPGVQAPRIVQTWRNRHGFLLGGEASAPAELRAFASWHGRRRPAPLYALPEGRFQVWITGLEPGAAAHVEIEDRTREVVIATDVHSLGVDEPEPEEAYPELFRPLWGGHPGSREARDIQALRAVADIPAPFRDEVTDHMNIPPFSHFPRRWWPAVLAWIEEGGVLGCNLLNVMRWAATPIPPVVTWHLLHRQADPEHALNVQVTDETDVEYLPVRESDLPPAAYLLIEEWCQRFPESRRGLYRLLVRLGKLRWGETGRTPFPLAVPGWRPRVEGDGPALVEHATQGFLPELLALASAAHEGDEAALTELRARSLGEDLEAELATVLLPVTRRRELIPDLLERFRTAPVERLAALDAALWGFRSTTGFSAEKGEERLLRRTFREFPATRVDSPTGASVVFRPEVSILYGLYHRDGHEVRFLGEHGEVRRFVVKVVSGYRPVDEDPR